MWTLPPGKMLKHCIRSSLLRQHGGMLVPKGRGVSALFLLRRLKTMGLEGVSDTGPGALESSAHNGQASAVPASQLRISSAKARRGDKLVNIKPISIILLLLHRPSSVRVLVSLLFRSRARHPGGDQPGVLTIMFLPSNRTTMVVVRHIESMPGLGR